MCNVCSEYFKNGISTFYSKKTDVGNGSTLVEGMLLDGACVSGDGTETYLSVKFCGKKEEYVDIKITHCPFCGKDINDPWGTEWVFGEVTSETSTVGILSKISKLATASGIEIVIGTENGKKCVTEFDFTEHDKRVVEEYLKNQKGDVNDKD